MIEESEWESIYQAINNRLSKKGEYFIASSVVKSDSFNRTVWISELGDQPIPIVDFSYEIKYYDTADPIGTVKMLAGVTVPENYMLAAGTSLSRAAFPELFNEIGVKYGFVDGTHFNLPDLRSRFIYGAAAGDLSDEGTVGGEATHVLSAAEMPSHTHIQNAHTHTSTGQNFAGTSFTAQVASGANFAAVNSTVSVATATATNQNTGGDGAHNNLPPYIRMAYIIKVSGSVVTEKKAKISVSVPMPGEIVLVALERGTNRLPRCLGKLQGKNFIMSTGDDA